MFKGSQKHYKLIVCTLLRLVRSPENPFLKKVSLTGKRGADPFRASSTFLVVVERITSSKNEKIDRDFVVY